MDLLTGCRPLAFDEVLYVCVVSTQARHGVKRISAVGASLVPIRAKLTPAPLVSGAGAGKAGSALLLAA